MEQLLRAREAALAGNLEDALGHALVAWRATRVPGLAKLVDELAEHVPRSASTTTGDLHARWMELEASQGPEERDRLLSMLMDGSPGQIEERLRAISQWDSDPRTAMFLAELVCQAPMVTASARRVWDKIFALLIQLSDPRTIPVLDSRFGTSFTGGVPSWFVFQLEHAVHALKQAWPKRPRLPHEGREIAEEIRALLRRDDSDPPPDLLARIYANPSDRDVRLVYADVLMERGDPRGEFVVLQLTEKRSREQQRRMQRLLKEHGDDWLGPLAGVVRKGDALFAGGFLSECTLIQRKDAEIEALIGNPAWATVRSLRLPDRAVGSAYVDVALRNPTMRSLRVLRGVYGEAVVEVCGGSTIRPLHTLGIRGMRLQNDVERDAVLWCTALPDLKRLEVLAHTDGPRGLKSVLNAPVAHRLESLGVELQWALRSVGAWLQALDDSPVPRASLSLDHWTLLLSRDEQGRLSSLRCEPTRARPNLSKLVEVLESIPEDGLTRIVIASNRRHGRLTRLASRFSRLEHVEGAGL